MADRNRPTQLSWDATDGNDSSSWSARRLAPNPPPAKPSSSRLPSVPKRPTSVPFESNSSVRQSQKGSKKIVLFRTFTTNDKKKKSVTTTTTSRHTSNETSSYVSSSRSDMSRRTPTAAFYNGNQPTPAAAAPAVRPTIIRPQTSKKPKPPRPPPPKINGSIGAHQPPSYDDVFGADVDAFIGEMRAPRPKLRAPPRPSAANTSTSTTTTTPNQFGDGPRRHPDDTNASPLIVFDDFPATVTGYGNARPTANSTSAAAGLSLLDLDNDFFMNGAWGSGSTSPVPPPAASQPLVTNRNPSSSFRGLAGTGSSSSASSSANGLRLNLGPRVLPPGPIPSLHSSATTSATSPMSSNSATAWSRPSVAAAEQSRSKGLSKGDDWLQSCLRGTASASNPTKTGGGASGGGSASWANSNSFVPQWDSSANPPLPPRPKKNGVDLHFQSEGSLSPNQSPEPPSATPPPVPPLPYSDLDSQFDDAKFDAPPLPPRPKNYETMRPHAIATYDYDATQADELSFKVNDIITLIHRVNESWLYGYTDASEGIFPQTFVEIVVPLSGDKTDVQDVSGPRCLALYDFVAETESELSLSAGDVVALDRKDSNDWYHGTLNGKSGVFPATFVEVVEDLPQSGAAVFNQHASRFDSTNQERSNLYVAIYDFEGESGELAFREGTKIQVTGTVNDEWMFGHLVGSDVEGRFPKSFVEKLG